MGKISLNELKIHLMCWSILILLEVVFVGLINQRFSPLKFYLLFYPLNAALFYFHSRITMSSVYKPRKRWLYFTLYLGLEISIYLLLSVYFSYLLNNGKPFKQLLTVAYFAGAFWRGCWFLAYSTGYFFLKVYIEEQKIESEKALEISGLKNQLITAEKEYLKAQLNPHLLFNTFSFVKYANKRNPAIASEAIQKLSEIISYAIQSGKRETVRIVEEVEQIEKVIYLNKLRFEKPLNIRFEKNISNSDAPILPVLLLTLVENIFKHGETVDLNYPSMIEIESSEKEISFKTTNYLANYPDEDGIKSGLNNVSSRLEAHHPGTHFFKYGMDGEVFTTQLKIFL